MGTDYVNNNLIEQSERLFTVRPRSAFEQNHTSGDRGTRARFRLLSSDASRGQRRDVSNFTTKENANYIVSRLTNQQLGGGYADFLLTNVSVNISEKVQVTQTFGDAEVVYYFGKAPLFYNIAGYLIDDVDNQWFTNFYEMYTNILRGSELARNYEMVELVLPNVALIGSVTSFGYNQDAARDTDIPFTMQLHIKQATVIPVRVSAQPLNPEVALINFTKAANLKDFTSVTKINSLKSKVIQMQKLLQDPASSTKDVRKVLNDLGSLGDFSSMQGQSSSLLGQTNIKSIMDKMGATGGLIGKGIDAAKSGFGNSTGQEITAVPDPLSNINFDGDFGDVFGGAMAPEVSRSIQQSQDLVQNQDWTDAGFDLPPGFKDIVTANTPNFLNSPATTNSASTTTVLGFRASLFSPVFGVLTSITKVVQTTGGDISKVFSSFSEGVNSVLRDIVGISTQALAIVNAVVQVPLNVINAITNTKTALKNTKGVISRLPEAISQSIKRLFKGGTSSNKTASLKGAPFLNGSAGFLTKGGTAPGSKLALLNSGKPYTPASGATVK
jgi:hypothetical protein